MAELFRILKPDGWAVVQVPVRKEEDTFELPQFNTPGKRLRYYGQADHVRYYGWKDFVTRLESVGFRVFIKQLAMHMNAELRERYRLDRYERFYWLRK